MKRLTLTVLSALLTTLALSLSASPAYAGWCC